MTSCGRALACLAVAAVSSVEPCAAGVWGWDPFVGVIGDYSTNPDLFDMGRTAETSGAVLFNAPTTYNGDAFLFTALPRLRLGNSQGFSSTTSDYEHLDLKSEFDTERSILSLAGSVARDSSLYHDYIVDGTAGVERNTVTADVNWDRQFSERVSFDADLNSARVRYGQAQGSATLTNYMYTSAAPTLSWDQSEKGKLTAGASAGLYKSLDGTTRSENANLQIGFVRRVTELWTVTATGGYSRAINTLHTDIERPVIIDGFLFFELVPAKIEASENGTVFTLNASRQAALLLVNVIASRQLVPSGFAYLSRQQSYEATASYPTSPRWTLSGDLRYVKSQDPVLTGTLDRNVRYASLSSAWRWTEQWTITTNLARVLEDLSAPHVNLASTEISIQISRQFNHMKF